MWLILKLSNWKQSKKHKKLCCIKIAARPRSFRATNVHAEGGPATATRNVAESHPLNDILYTHHVGGGRPVHAAATITTQPVHEGE